MKGGTRGIKFSGGSLNNAGTIWRRTTKFNRITRGEGRIFRRSATPLPQGAGPQRSPILGFPSIYAYTLCRRSTKIDVVTHMGTGFGFRGQSRPTPKRARSQRSPILGVPYIYACTFYHRTMKFDVVTHIGRWLVSRWSATHPSQGDGVPAFPNFWGSFLIMYTLFVAKLPHFTR